MSTKYTYSVADDTANAAADLNALTAEITASAIVTALDYIEATGDVLDVWFKADLASGDETILDGLIAAHTGVSIIVDEPVDCDGSKLFRPKACKAGCTYQNRGFEFHTSTLASIYSKDYENEATSDITIKFYNSSDEELTTQNDLDSLCVKTVIDFEPIYNYEIIGGGANMLSVPSNDVRIYVVAVPDLTPVQGGTKIMINQRNFKHKQYVSINGRSCKGLAYSETLHTNKLRFILYHTAGEKHDLEVEIELYKA